MKHTFALARRLWLPLALLVAVALVARALYLGLIRPGWAYQWEWTGLGVTKIDVTTSIPQFPHVRVSLPYKNAWDWMQLVFVPLIVGVAAVTIDRRLERRNRQQEADNERQRETREARDRLEREEGAKRQQLIDDLRATDRQQEDVLTEYLDAMSSLTLTNKLASQPRVDPGWSVARARTLTVLERLTPRRWTTATSESAEQQANAEDLALSLRLRQDAGRRKGLVIRFLIESNVLKSKIPAPDAADATASSDRVSVSLAGANLADATLNGAHLSGADLNGAHLNGANLSLADLSGAHLSGTNLNGTNLSRANLNGAHLNGAELIGAHLNGANVTNEQLNQSANLARATLPNGTELPDDFMGSLPPD